MRLCLSIAPDSIDEALVLLRRHRRDAELIEVRIDGLRTPDLGRLLKTPRPPLIITNRIAEEGGRFTGPADEEVRLLREAIRLGAEYVDIELRWGARLIRSLQTIAVKTRFIISHHDLDRHTPNIFQIYDKARKIGADVVKIAYPANTLRDNDRIFELYDRARKDRQALIAIAMGPYGQISRILPARSNAFLTYASLNDAGKSAPGQLNARDLTSTFRIQSINRRTAMFGLLGNPVSHSRGIIFHNDVFRKKKLNAVYVNVLCDDLDHFFDRYMRLFAGMSVTMPFKDDVIRFLDRVSDESRVLGAVNTIVRKNGRLIGSNTDLPAITTLLKKNISLRGADVTVIGTGATAATMVYAAQSLGGSVTVLGRDAAKARLLSGRYGVSWAPIEELPRLKCKLLISAIPSVAPTDDGMRKDPGKDVICNLLPDSLFRTGMTIFDASYGPGLTPLLQRAKSSGCGIIRGVDLFTAQARLQSRVFLTAIP